MIRPDPTSLQRNANNKSASLDQDLKKASDALARAVDYHRSGDLALAEEIYLQLIGQNPSNPDALHLLGLIERQRQEFENALVLIKKAIQINPEIVQYHCSLGSCYLKLGRLSEGLACYRKALTLKPDCIEAYNEMGNALSKTGRVEDSIDYFHKALVIRPDSFEVFNNLGVTYQQLNKPDKALACYRKAIEINSDYAEAHYNMGNILSSQGKFADAIGYYSNAIASNPSYIKALNSMGNAFISTGNFNKALECYRKILVLDPRNADAYINMGVALMEQAQHQEAIEAFHRALDIRPESTEAYSNLAIAMRNAGRLSEAIKCLRNVLSIDPENDQAYNNLGNAYKESGNIDDALDCYRQALEIRPDYAEANSNMLFTMNYDSRIDQQTILLEAQKWWQKNHTLIPQPNHSDSRARADKPLKIGYMSPDFRQHAVSNFMIPLLEAHDRNKVEVYCYAAVKRPDKITEQIRNLADHWRSVIGTPDGAVADMIRKDGIAILVDLAGHTAGNRLQIFAHKPAPIQVSWLGYPNTTGLPQMDYRLTDEIADPEGEADELHSERLLRLPNGFLCYSPFEDSPEIIPNDPAGKRPVTFGCFNNLTKINTQVISTWTKILNGVPDSHLILKNKQLSDKPLRDQFLDLFARQGIRADRIEIMGPTPTFWEHLDLYNRIDIGLDPFPYTGTTSTCEALWMGVPVITLCGDRHASRVGSSILTRIGFGELAAANEADYVAGAIALASDRKRLHHIKSEIGAAFRASPICDKHSFARDIESLFHEIWLKWRTAEPGRFNPCQIPKNNAKNSSLAKVSQSLTASATENKRARIEAQVNNFPFWYHKIALPHGATTPGWAPINPAAYRIPDRLDGKRVLDVGAWDGYWSFEALRRGAREVMAIDDFSDFLGQLKSSDRKAWDTFDLCRGLLGYSSQACQRFELNVYDLNETAHGRFDVIFFFGTLYHLRYPMLALDRLSAICDGEIFIESAILDDYSPYQGGLGHGYPNKQMVMEFYPENQYGKNDSNWWVPSLHCLKNMAKAAGFKDCQSWKLETSPESLPNCRGFVHAKK